MQYAGVLLSFVLAAVVALPVLVLVLVLFCRIRVFLVVFVRNDLTFDAKTRQVAEFCRGRGLRTDTQRGDCSRRGRRGGWIRRGERVPAEEMRGLHLKWTLL
jgi:hypothetical protein